MARRRTSSSFSRITRYPNRVMDAQNRVTYAAAVVDQCARLFAEKMDDRSAYMLYVAGRNAIKNAHLAYNNGQTVADVIAEQEAIFRLKKEAEAEQGTLTVQKPQITIQRTPRGSYDFHPPYSNDKFLEAFYLRIGKPFRTWNTFKNCWQIKPLDTEMVEMIASLLNTYFPAYSAVIVHEPQKIAA